MDFRRVPTVWSQLTADEASVRVGREEKPRPPTITIYADQPKNNSSQSMDGLEMGHTMIGIEYSRFSQISMRYERYKLKYGFYPVMGRAKVSKSLGMLSHDAIIPGQLMDDFEHGYTVSRRYPATAKQVNDILNASETYADGGYGYFSRNCATFVRDMAKVAHLPASDKLFELEEVRFSDIANLGRIGAEFPGENNLNGIEEGLLSLSQEKDESYANYGSKRATEQDFKNLHNSVRNGPAEIKETYTPATVGEKMRRETAGEIGFQNYKGAITKNKDPEQIMDEINRSGTALKEVIESQLLPEAQNSNKEIPNELNQIILSLPQSGNMLELIVAAHKEEEESVAPMIVIQNARQKLSARISCLNRLYFQYFKADKRLYEPLQKLISVMNIAINLLDEQYKLAFSFENEDPDLGDLPLDINNLKEISYQDIKIEITPSSYEAYLQIYKTPEKAIKAYHQYNELKKMEENGINWSLHPQLKKEYDKHKRINNLAQDFLRSHRYMLEKNQYNQQDVDYAFMEIERERQGEVSGSLLGNSSGNIYLSLIREQVPCPIRDTMYFRLRSLFDAYWLRDNGTTG